MIRVARCKYVYGRMVIPTYPEFEPIVVMTPSTKYGSLSPYVLRRVLPDSDGLVRSQLMENIWQFSKVYHKVPKAKEYYSRYDRTVIWEHPEETHLVDGELTEEYWSWREKGMNAKHPIRYPTGFHHRGQCSYALAKRGGKQLSYIQARKVIYLPVYHELVITQPQFKQLLDKLKDGINLLIIEVDGPHQESLNYYKEKYGVGDEFIEKDSMPVTRENLKIMLNDPKHPFGHGYCLAMSLISELAI